jgi:hypothetical protein
MNLRAGAEEALRSSQPPRTSTHHRFLTSEVEEEARRGRRTAVGSGDPYKGRRKPWRAKEVSPSCPSSIAREGAFTFPPEPARATPPPPKIARPRRHELGCKETRVSGVSPEPGGEAGFGCREPGQLAGQCHANTACSPGAQPSPWAALANAPIVFYKSMVNFFLKSHPQIFKRILFFFYLEHLI